MRCMPLTHIRSKGRGAKTSISGPIGRQTGTEPPPTRSVSNRKQCALVVNAIAMRPYVARIKIRWQAVTLEFMCTHPTGKKKPHRFHVRDTFGSFALVIDSEGRRREREGKKSGIRVSLLVPSLFLLTPLPASSSFFLPPCCMRVRLLPLCVCRLFMIPFCSSPRESCMRTARGCR